MKKIYALLLVAIPLLGFTLPAYADSPGQLAGGPDLYQVRNVTTNSAYSSSVSANCNDVVKYSVKLANSEFGELQNVTIKASLANGGMTASAVNSANQNTSVSGNVTVNHTNGNLNYIAGSTKNYDVNGNLIKNLPDGVTAGGVNKGTLNGSTREFVQFEAKVVCDAPPTQSLQCTVLNLTIVDQEKRQVRASVTGQALNGATISGYSINFGDGTTVNQQTADHTYAKDGSYNVVGYVSGTVNGNPATVTGAGCAQTAHINVTPPPKPPTPPTPTPETPVIGSVIPNTGAEGIAALVAGTSGLAAAGHQLFMRRRK